MPLGFAYPGSGGKPPCILTDGGTVPKAGPWCAIFVNSDARSLKIGDLDTLPKVVAQFENTLPLTFLAIVYFQKPPVGTDLSILANALASYPWSKIGIAKYGGIVLWLDDPNTVSAAAIGKAACLPMKPVRRAAPALVAPESHPLLSLATDGSAAPNVFLTGDKVSVGADPTGGALRLTGASTLSIALGTGHADPAQIIATLSPRSADIPITGANCGDLAIAGTFGTPLATVGVGFRFGFEAPETSPPLAYPLFDADDGLNGHPFTGTLSLLAPADPARSNWSLTPGQSATIVSAFRTITGQKIALAPTSGGASQLLFNTVANRLYLTPSGQFQISIPGVNSGADPIPLICGLSGVEYLALQPGSLLAFRAGQPAAIAVTRNPDLEKPADVTFQLDRGNTTQTTAWATALPADGKTPIPYYSEPNQAPFFVAAQSGDLELDYFPWTRSALPGTASPPSAGNCFPLMSYGAVAKAASGYGGDPAYISAFEYQVINPTRAACIEAMRVAAPASQASVLAATPQGYVATLVNGAWTKLEVAETSAGGSSVSITFAPASGQAALPDALQDAFLTNQQFLVITAQTAALGAFTASITLDGWPFTLDFSKNDKVGDYSNVLLFKSGNATIRQMASHPELWTGYPNFNDVASDPDGRFVSNWLVAYLDEAIALYDGGKGIASLGEFCGLIDDPNWNGFLALKVGVGDANLPPTIQALLSGIDKSLFYAHHLGNQANHLTPTSGGYDLASSVFALVRYQDPQLGGANVVIPQFLASPSDFDFRVLTLEAVFENAKLQSFSNKSLLLLNRLFGDQVVQGNSVNPTSASGCNNLLLIGTYRMIDGTPSYTFATASGSVGDFYLASNAFDRIEIAKAMMSVDSVSAGYQATFSLSGNFAFAADAAFDLLSYTYLEFQGLAVDMTFQSGGEDRNFTFDTARLALTLNQNKLADSSGGPPPGGFNLVRGGSLLSQFPLALTGFVIGTADSQPDSLGYRVLKTEIPKGISAPSLSGSPWYALNFGMNLGGQGSLGSSGLLSAELLLAWTPGGSGAGPSVAPLLKIAGPGGVNLSFDLEGVIKFGAADIVLNRIPASAPDRFVMIFESIAITILLLSFPPQGTTNVFLFGDTSGGGGGVVKPTLGWFGGYVEKPAGGTH